MQAARREDQGLEPLGPEIVVPFQAHAVRKHQAHAQRTGRRDDADEAGLALCNRFSTQQAAARQDTFPGVQLLRLQTFGSRIVGNAAVEGIRGSNVIEPVQLAFGDMGVAHHRLL